jgi:hypothetical protein
MPLALIVLILDADTPKFTSVSTTRHCKAISTSHGQPTREWASIRILMASIDNGNQHGVEASSQILTLSSISLVRPAETTSMLPELIMINGTAALVPLRICGSLLPAQRTAASHKRKLLPDLLMVSASTTQVVSNTPTLMWASQTSKAPVVLCQWLLPWPSLSSPSPSSHSDHEKCL